MKSVHLNGRPMLVRLSLAVAATALLTAPAAASGDDPAPRFDPPKSYYLALGDSITYGFQFSKFAAGLPPSGFDTGYVDVFAARLRTIRPRISVVNYGCPGESTTSFIAGPCFFTQIGGSLHDSFAGSQLDAATAFLRAHPGQVSPITVHLFGNDVNELFSLCGGDFDCIRREAPAAIAGLASRLDLILGRLRSAAANAEVIVIGGWGTFPVADVEVDSLFRAATGAIADVAAQRRAFFADMLPLFNPPGAARLGAICTLTLLCSDGDGHPSDAGYQAIADAVFETSGYGRLGD